MKNYIKKIEIQTTKSEEAIDITSLVKNAVEKSGVKEGIVNILNLHTSAGIIVTEGLVCLEEDVLNCLARLAPASGNYHHRRYLDKDGRIAFNADTHLKSMLGGISASFPITEGQMVMGSRQTIYFLEFDGPLCRTFCVQVLGWE